MVLERFVTGLGMGAWPGPGRDVVAVAGAGKGGALGDQQGLADRVRMPGGAGAGVMWAQPQAMRDGSGLRVLVASV